MVVATRAARAKVRAWVRGCSATWPPRSKTLCQGGRICTGMRGLSKQHDKKHDINNKQGEGREGVETPIHRASPSVMRASRGVRRSNCKQIWLRVHDPSEGMLKLLLYKILLV